MLAPIGPDGSINDDQFEAYVIRVRLPRRRCCDVFTTKNLSKHKRPVMRAIIEAVRAILRFLPPYSPDFDMIEKAFSRINAMLRAPRERTFPAYASLAAGSSTSSSQTSVSIAANHAVMNWNERETLEGQLPAKA